MRSDLNKVDSFTLEMSKNQPIRNFLRNDRLRVNERVPLNERNILKFTVR